jgi:HD-GYP domain-containing protein (c-di-GMP phosphodiesterase class II)
MTRALSRAANPMRKKIKVSQLQMGMFVDELCGSWLDNPFWSTRFLVEKPAEINQLVASPVRELWIDTARGLDVQDVQSASEVAAQNEAVLQNIATQAESPARKESLDAEIARAARICDRARTAVMSMFQEARMGKAVATEQLTPLVDEISASVLRNPGALVSLARLKTVDDYTYLHSVAVCGLMIALARQLGLPESDMREIGMAGLVHDLGKADIPDAILNKPGKLTDAEFEIIKNHPAAGHRMLLEGQGVGAVPLDVSLHHHEKIDGSGYPHRLAGDAISLYAKMGAVCDVYDAITSIRAYKAPWSPAESLRKMAEWSNGHFDRAVFHAFIKCVGIYPVGSLVRLESGLLGVVIDNPTENLLAPSVKVFFCTRRKARMPPKVIDLARSNAKDKIKNWESPTKWPFPDIDEMWSGREARR